MLLFALILEQIGVGKLQSILRLDKFNMQKLDLHFSTMTTYDPSFFRINVLYEKEVLKNTLGEVLELK